MKMILNLRKIAIKSSHSNENKFKSSEYCYKSSYSNENEFKSPEYCNKILPL